MRDESHESAPGVVRVVAGWLDRMRGAGQAETRFEAAGVQGLMGDNRRIDMGAVLELPPELLREREALAADAEERLDDVLSRWHSWQQAQRLRGVGYKPRSLVVGEYVCSRQYDDTNGALDDVLDDARSRAVDAQVSELEEPLRTAVYMLARNLATGCSVWVSPRLPADRVAREGIVDQARRRIARRLRSAGVLC